MKTDVVVSTASSSRLKGIFPKLGSPTVNATKLGADPAFAVSEIVVATNASTKMTSQIFKKTTACVFHVCWLKFLLYPEKKDMSREGWMISVQLQHAVKSSVWY